MIDLGKIIQNLKSDGARSGYGPALMHMFYYSANKLLNLRRLEIIYLTREHLIPLDPSKYSKHSSSLATKEDLVRMRSEGTWDISDELIEGFKNGDSCVLSSVNGKLAGYTWVHVGGHPLLTSGLRISIPPEYIYNFAGFTLPEFRGFGLQPYRHNIIMSHPAWKDKKGMIGFVECTNWNSKKGQSKSGYQRLGYLTLIGSRKSFVVFFSGAVKKLGIRRLPA